MSKLEFISKLNLGEISFSVLDWRTCKGYVSRSVSKQKKFDIFFVSGKASSENKLIEKAS
jgi:hypothetical protein